MNINHLKPLICESSVVANLWIIVLSVSAPSAECDSDLSSFVSFSLLSDASVFISDVSRVIIAPVGDCGLDSCLSTAVSDVEEPLIIMHVFITVGGCGRTSLLRQSGSCLNGLDASKGVVLHGALRISVSTDSKPLCPGSSCLCLSNRGISAKMNKGY